MPSYARIGAGLTFPAVFLLLAACGGMSSGGPEPAASGSPTTAASAPRSPRVEAPGGPAPGGRPQGSKGPGAAGSPLRIPLPTDELLGRELSDAQRQLRQLIAAACGGDQCISLAVTADGSLDPDGRTGCTTHVRNVPGTTAEDTGQGWSIPVLYVPRGGTITLVVELWCDEVPSPGPSEVPSATATP
ncbi:hypothetical protein [Asanoa siamensis]|uniref:Uncharacterized protein n=1 Tax=Asanoa siamensis TaxID=926357 RepID=A0ABQ4CQA5_9ACTN|nr:hypothetical protein [Asanoa siamensis]GIF73042.1 hypothetical protein Asi02nite_25600 [Asanoa siamensis]